MSAKKSGRITEITSGGKAGIIQDPDGNEYPFTADIATTPGQVVLFEVDDRAIGTAEDGSEVKTSFAKVTDV